MKHLLSVFILFAAILISTVGYSQTFKPGVFGGIVGSQVGGDSYSGFNKLGVTFGGFVRYDLSNSWSAQFEIAYVQKGSRNNFSITENDPSQSAERFLMRLNYIEIPLLFKFDHRNFVYEGGLYYARMVGFYLEYFDGYSTSGPFNSLDDFNDRLRQTGQTKEMKDYDFGAMIGVGYKLTDNLLGSIRISNSLMAIKDFESGAKDFYPTSLRVGFTNTVLLGTFRYTFGEGDENPMPKKAE